MNDFLQKELKNSIFQWFFYGFLLTVQINSDGSLSNVQTYYSR